MGDGFDQFWVQHNNSVYHLVLLVLFGGSNTREPIKRSK